MPYPSYVAKLAVLTLASLLGLGGFENGRCGETAPIPFQIRGATRTAEDNAKPITWNTPKGAETIYVREDVVLTLRDIKAVEMVYNASGFTIELKVTQDGAKHISDYSESHTGEYAAVLVAGHVVASPFIGKKMTIRDSFLIGPFNEAQCREVYKIINDALKTERRGG
jgi:preprotein translocase subunit SecD